jgi:hypothetical protein
MAEPGLVELATAEEQNAKRLLFNYLPLCHLAAAVLTAAALFTPLPWAYVLAVLIFALEVGAWQLRRAALAKHRLADQARRRALLINALGTSSERLDVADLRGSFSKKACEKASVITRPGYWAQGGGGLADVLANLQESAFWSKHLYGQAAKRMWGIAAGSALALSGIIFAGLLFSSGDTELAVARVFVVALSLLIGLDLLGQALAWSLAAREAGTVDRRLQHLDGAALEDPLLAIIADYAVATSIAPPIPDFFYERDEDKLDALWRNHRASP